MRGMSATDHARTTASRAAQSKPLEYIARGGFIGYGIIHLLFAWLALQIAFSGSGTETDQSGALRKLAEQPAGKAVVVLIIIGLVAMAIWQAFEAAIGESGQTGRTAIAERVISGCRAVLYAYFAYLGYKVVSGANSSQADSQEAATAKLMDESGGRFRSASSGSSCSASASAW
jgi:hypothetical protein